MGNIDLLFASLSWASARRRGFGTRGAATFRAAKMPELEIQAHTILAQTLLAQEKLSQARQEIAQGKPLAAKTQQRLVRLRFEIVAAQVLAASGKPSDLQAARSALDAMIRETEKIQMLSDLFEARFARGDIEMKYGNQADGRIRLAAVEKEAASSGFALITKKQINQKLGNHTR